jgi:hypothetical protein
LLKRISPLVNYIYNYSLYIWASSFFLWHMDFHCWIFWFLFLALGLAIWVGLFHNFWCWQLYVWALSHFSGWWALNVCFGLDWLWVGFPILGRQLYIYVLNLSFLFWHVRLHHLQWIFNKSTISPLKSTHLQATNYKKKCLFRLQSTIRIWANSYALF